jgi:hypothetical protein
MTNYALQDKFFVHLIALLECVEIAMTEKGMSDSDVQPVRDAIKIHQSEEDLGACDEDSTTISLMLGGILMGHPTYDIEEDVDTQALTDIARLFVARFILIDL